jgi:hypothetical protein
VALLLYIPFRLLASHTNTVFWGDSDNFYYRSAVLVWPAYVFLSMGLVYFTSGALGFSLVPDLFAIILMAILSDYSWRLDRLLGLAGGETGSLTMTSGLTWNTTWLSQELCLVSIPLGLVLGKAAGLLLYRRARDQGALREMRHRADWRTVAAHVLNAGFAAPVLAIVSGGAAMAASHPLEDPGIHDAGDAVIFLSALAIGYAAGLAFSLGFVLPGRRLRRPERSARMASAIYAVLLCGWGFVALSLPGWGVAGRVAVCILTVFAIVAFAALTRRRFAGMRAEAGPEEA